MTVVSPGVVAEVKQKYCEFSAICVEKPNNVVEDNNVAEVIKFKAAKTNKSGI